MRHLVVAGGVASNAYIRARLSAVAQQAGLQLVCPPPRLCTDNGVMVAWAGVERCAALLGYGAVCAGRECIVWGAGMDQTEQGLCHPPSSSNVLTSCCCMLDTCRCRLQLGLVEAPPASQELGEGEWVDLRPRWPLTDRKDPRRYVGMCGHRSC